MYLHYTQQHADVKKKSNSATSWMQPDGSARGGFEERLFVQFLPLIGKRTAQEIIL
jgi:hypothetical protein